MKYGDCFSKSIMKCRSVWSSAVSLSMGSSAERGLGKGDINLKLNIKKYFLSIHLCTSVKYEERNLNIINLQKQSHNLKNCEVNRARSRLLLAICRSIGMSIYNMLILHNFSTRGLSATFMLAREMFGHPQ